MGYRDYQVAMGLSSRVLSPDITFVDVSGEMFNAVIYFKNDVPQIGYFYTATMNTDEVMEAFREKIGDFDFELDHRGLGHFMVDIKVKT